MADDKAEKIKDAIKDLDPETETEQQKTQYGVAVKAKGGFSDKTETRQDIVFLPEGYDPHADPDDEEAYKRNKAALKKDQEVRARFFHGMNLLSSTSWWFGWRGTVIGRPIIIYGKAVPTAAVGFNPSTGRIDFYFNGNFCYDRLTAGDIAFIIAHESLHAILDHLGRMKSYHKLWNIVTDAFINEDLHRNLDWHALVDHQDRLDFMLKEGIRWESLKKFDPDIEKQFPYEDVDQYTCDQVYLHIIGKLKEQGIDPKEIEQFGDEVELDAGGGKSKPIIRRVPLEEGDIVRDKQSGKVGKVISIDRSDPDDIRVKVGLVDEKKTEFDRKGKRGKIIQGK